ncbi:MAG: nitrogenase component 1 [Dehalococcoidia bacterium]
MPRYIPSSCELSIKSFCGSAGELKAALAEKRMMDNPLLASCNQCKFHAAAHVFQFMKDAIPLVHGPVGCAHNKLYCPRAGVRFLAPYVATTALNEQDVVFGGEQKLEEAIRWVDTTFRPNLIGVLATCVVGLIGDDIDRVVKKVQPQVKAKVVAVHSEGLAGRGQGYGYDETFSVLVHEVMKEQKEKIPNSVNIWGVWRPSSIDLDIIELRRLLNECGIHVHAVVTGGSTLEDIETAPKAMLNLLRCEAMCIDSAAEMEKVFGTPYALKEIPIGIESTKVWVMSAAEVLGLEGKAGPIMDKEADVAYKEIADVLPELKGKRVAVNLAQSRALFFSKFCRELGMDLVFLGSSWTRRNFSEFLDLCHPDLKSDVRMAISPSRYEIEYWMKELKPDIYLGGDAEAHWIRRYGIAFVQLHTERWYGIQGAVRLAKAMAKSLHSPLRDRLARIWEEQAYVSPPSDLPGLKNVLDADQSGQGAPTGEFDGGNHESDGCSLGQGREGKGGRG